MWEWQCPHGLTISETMSCEIGSPWETAAYRIYIWGDSHMGHFLPLMAVAGEGQDVSVRSLRGGCSPIIDGFGLRHTCPRCRTTIPHVKEFYAANLEHLRSEKSANLLVIASAWSAIPGLLAQGRDANGSRSLALHFFRTGFENMLADVVRPNRNVVIILDVPRWEIDPIPCIVSQETTLLRRERCTEDRATLSWALFNKEQREIHDLLREYNGRDGITVISPEDYLCDQAGCRTTINGEFIYRDAGHLRRNLSPETLRQLAHVLRFDELFPSESRETVPTGSFN